MSLDTTTRFSVIQVFGYPLLMYLKKYHIISILPSCAISTMLLRSIKTQHGDYIGEDTFKRKEK